MEFKKMVRVLEVRPSADIKTATTTSKFYFEWSEVLVHSKSVTLQQEGGHSISIDVYDRHELLMVRTHVDTIDNEVTLVTDVYIQLPTYAPPA